MKQYNTRVVARTNPVQAPDPTKFFGVPTGTKEWLRDTFHRVVIHPEERKGRYTIAKGKHGKVIRAEDTRTSPTAPVVIKSEPHSKRVDYERQLHAYVTAKKVPHVMPLLAVADGEKKAYSVLPMGKPLSLTDPMPLGEARRVMLELIDALEHLHQEGVYHRDVKRKNIMMDRDTHEACLVDWGKATVRPTPLRARIFARADWRKAAGVFGRMLGQCPEVTKWQRFKWRMWWRTLDRIDGEILRQHPLLGGTHMGLKAHYGLGFQLMGCMLLEGATAHDAVYDYFPVPVPQVSRHPHPLR